MKKLYFFTALLLALLLLVCACSEKEGENVETLPETLPETIPEAITDASSDITATTTDVQADTLPTTDTEATDEDVTEALTDPETLPETEALTEAPTEAETDATVDDLLESVMSQNQLDNLSDYRIVTDMKIDLTASLNGMQTTMALTGGLQMVQAASGGMSLQLNIPTMEPYALVYTDGMMYVSSADGNFRCPMTDEELSLVWSELLGDDFSADGETENGMSGMLGSMSDLLSLMPLSALFAESEIITDEASGDTTVTLKGISPEAQMIIKLLTSSMEIPDMQGVSDMDLSLILDTLSTFDMDAFGISLTVDKNLYIKASTVTMALDMLSVPELLGDIPLTATITMNTTLDREPQTVTAPEDADSYEETDWRTLFGIYTAEYLGLIPDENGVITLSEDADTFALQYEYISQNPTDFADTTLSLTARASDFALLEDGVVRGTLYQVYEDGTAAYYPYLYVCFPADLADGMMLPEDGSTVRITATLVIAEEGEAYYDLTASTYQLVSAPAVSG